MRVVIAEAAYAGIAGIGRYVKRNNPRRTTTFANKFFVRCRQLGQMRYVNPLVPNQEDRGVRRRICGKYLIFYRVEGDCVEVLRDLHGARDYQKILFPDD